MAFDNQKIVQINGYEFNGNDNRNIPTELIAPFNCHQSNIMKINPVLIQIPQQIEIYRQDSRQFEKQPAEILIKPSAIYKHIQPTVPRAVLRNSIQTYNDTENQQRLGFLTNTNNLFPLHLGLLFQQQRNFVLNSLCTQPQFSTGPNWFNNSHTHEYQYDFLNHLRQREQNFELKPNYLQQQQDIDYTARTYLIDWLVLVTREQDFDTETLYLAVAYVDRFLSLVIFPRCKLQLVGATAIYIAAKYEETRLSGVRKFGFIGGIQFNTEQIVQLERFVLRTLNFDLHIPTAYSFVDTYAMLVEMPHILKFLTLYLCELSLLETEPYIKFKPSLISAAAHCLARYLLGFSIWSLELEKLTTYRLENLKEAFLCLCRTHLASTTILPGAIQMKYTEEKYHQVASISPVIVADCLFDFFVQKYYNLI